MMTFVIPFGFASSLAVAAILIIVLAIAVVEHETTMWFIGALLLELFMVCVVVGLGLLMRHMLAAAGRQLATSDDLSLNETSMITMNISQGDNG
jgi:hypothetical protein